MFFRKREKKQNIIYPRAARKRKNFFEKKEKEAPNPFFLRLILRILIIFFVALVIYVIFFSPFLEIRKIYLGGVSELDYDDVYQKINNSLEGKYLRFIPRNNFIIASSDQINKGLLDNFKKIREVKVGKKFPDEIRVEIVEREALLVWCSSGSCYIMDENGYAYVGVDFESEEIKQNHLINIEDTSAKPVAQGEKVLNEDYINFVISLREKLEKETGIKIREEYKTQSRVAEEIRIMNEEGWEIYFSTTLPLENSIRTLQTFLEKEVDQEKRNKLEYIDLRAENKVYYKFRDEEEKIDGEQKIDESQAEQIKGESAKDAKNDKNKD